VDLQTFLRALRARFGTFALVLLSTVLAATAVGLLLPKKYTGTTSLLLDSKLEQSLSNVLQPLVPPQERVSYLQTQTGIITSKRVALRVVQDLKLADDPKLRVAFEASMRGGKIEDWLAEGLREGLEVNTSQSSVVEIVYSSDDPRFAARTANAFAKAYSDTLLELRVEPTREAAAWFDEQLESLRASLQDAQAKLTAYYRTRGIVSDDERFDLESVRLGELSSQLAGAQDQTLQWKTREQQAREVLGQRGSADEVPEVLENALIQKLKLDLLAGETKLRELATRYGPNHPQYLSQVSENRMLREKLDAEASKVLAGLESSTRQNRRRETELRAALAKQRARVLDLKEDRNQLTVLKRNVESAERAYDTAMQRFVVSQVESRANQTNVTVLNPAAVPRRPSSPRLLLNAALSAVAGSMLGLGIVMLLELIDRRVRSREDLERQPDVPFIGVLSPWRPRTVPRLRRLYGSARALPYLR
jgi:chain length determinant protein EpsF